MSIKQAKLKTFFSSHLYLLQAISIIVVSFFLFLLLNQVLLIENTVLLLLIQQLIFLIPVAYFVKIKKITFDDLGFKIFKPARAVGAIISTYLAYLILSALFMAFVQYLGVEIPGYGQQESYLPIFAGYSLITTTILVCIIAPTIEEILFRGLFLKLSPYSKYYKVFLNGLIFSLFHFQFQVFIPILILGMLIANLRISQKSIYPSIIFHIINNFIALYADYFLR
jgi:hypothetical protein